VEAPCYCREMAEPAIASEADQKVADIPVAAEESSTAVEADTGGKFVACWD
jgi:hypothetical protein